MEQLRKTDEVLQSETPGRGHSGKTIEESQYLLSDIMDFLPDPTFVINRKGKIVAWNRAIEEMTGVKAGEMLGKGNYEYAQLAYGKRSPVLVDLVFQPNAVLEREYSFIRKEQDVLIAEVAVPFLNGRSWHLWCKASPICDAKGEVIGAIECMRDVTEAKLHVRELREREALFRTLAENDPMGISLMRGDATFEYMNPRFTEILGYTIEDLPDQMKWFECAYPDPVYRHQNLTFWKEHLIAGGTLGMVVDTTTRVCCKDGSEKLISIRAVVMEDGRHLLTYLDITQHRKHEALLRQSQKLEAIGTLAGGIAHDFNNILAPIIGYTEMALNELPTESRLGRNLTQVLKSACRAKELVKQILTFSRQSEQERIPVHVVPIVKEACHLLRASLPSTIDLRLNVPADASFSTILADPTQIHQVLMNLCTNACYAMREKGGILEVALCNLELGADFVSQYMGANPGPYLRLSVSDTGPGMSAEIQQRIFEPYFTTKEHGEGTGMGLATVLGIVKNHKGAITVRSAPGYGATFNMFFPRAIEAVKAEESRSAAPNPGMGNILFVDDEEPLREMAKHILGEFGYSVVVKRDGKEALDVFRALPDMFDLVITDYTMPRMTGGDLAREILHIRPDMQIVLCTGYSDAISEREAREMGVQEFLMKPVSFMALAEMITKILRSRDVQPSVAVKTG